MRLYEKNVRLDNFAMQILRTVGNVKSQLNVLYNDHLFDVFDRKSDGPQVGVVPGRVSTASRWRGRSSFVFIKRKRRSQRPTLRPRTKPQTSECVFDSDDLIAQPDLAVIFSINSTNFNGMGQLVATLITPPQQRSRLL